MKSLTVGSATIDTIAIIASDRIERMSMLNADASFLLLQEGSKTEALEISTHSGGGAVNAAVSLARQGFDAAALVKLGQDQRAETILAGLMREGISTRWALRDARAPTGASVLVSSHERNAAIFTFRGANTLLEPADLKDDAFAVDLVHIASLSNASADCFPLLVDKARNQGARISVNPGPRQLAARGVAFQECLAKIDILSINRAEAEVMLPSLVARFGEGGGPLGADGAPRLARRGLTGGGFHMGLARFMGAVADRRRPWRLRRLGRRHRPLRAASRRGGGHGGSRRCLRLDVRGHDRRRRTFGQGAAGGLAQCGERRRPRRYPDRPPAPRGDRHAPEIGRRNARRDALGAMMPRRCHLSRLGDAS
jgi:ribokinase